MNVYKLSSGDIIVLDKVERVICYTENSGYGGIYGYMLKIFFDSGKELTYKYNEIKERNEEYDRIVEQLRGQDSVLDSKEECSEEEKKIDIGKLISGERVVVFDDGRVLIFKRNKNGECVLELGEDEE